MSVPIVSKYCHPNNYWEGRAGHPVRFIAVHWIVGTLASADGVFANGNSQVSAHYAVGQKEIHRYVSESNTAFSNGRPDDNYPSISIEHEGGPNIPITEAVYRNSAYLIQQIWKRHGKLPIYPHSKFIGTQCPGTLDIDKLTRMAEGDEMVNRSQVFHLVRQYLGKDPSETTLEKWVGKKEWGWCVEYLKSSPTYQLRIAAAAQGELKAQNHLPSALRAAFVAPSPPSAVDLTPGLYKVN